MIGRKKTFTVDDSRMQIPFECPYCQREDEQAFEECCAAGYEVVRCNNEQCDRLFIIEWASCIECRSGKIDFPNAQGLLLSPRQTDNDSSH